MKPFIDPSFWSDSDIESVKPGVKLAVLWLITNSQTSLIGLCSASAARFKFETGLDPKALDAAIKALPRAFSRFDNTIYLRNYVRHQFGSGDKLIRNNFFVTLRSLFDGVKDEKLRAAIIEDYPEFTIASKSQGLVKPFKGVVKDKDRTGKEKEKEKVTIVYPVNSSDYFRSRFEEWIRVRRGMGKKPVEWSAMFNEQIRWLESFPEPMRLEIISQSIRNNWQGLVEVKKGNNNGNHQGHSTESSRSRGTANEGVSAQYRGIGKLRSKLPDAERPAA